MKLKEERQKIGKTQEEVALDLGLQKQTYQNYEYEKRQPDIETLIKLANYFHVSVDYLIENECKQKLDLTSLTDEQNEAILLIQQLNKQNCSRVVAYAEGLLIGQEEHQEVVKKLKNLD